MAEQERIAHLERKIQTKDEVDWRERYGRVNEHNGWVPRD